MNTIRIDRTCLQQIYGSECDMLPNIWSEFIQTHTEIKCSLLTSFTSGKVDRLKETLHHHSSSFQYLGFPMIMNACRNLYDRCSKTTNVKEMENDFFVLLNMIDRSKEVVAKEIENSAL